jgi:hypothetical protein
VTAIGGSPLIVYQTSNSPPIVADQKCSDSPHLPQRVHAALLLSVESSFPLPPSQGLHLQGFEWGGVVHLPLVRHVLSLVEDVKASNWAEGVKSMSTLSQERRRADRIPYLLEVKCKDFGPGSLRISDLSRTGAFIDTLLSVRIGSVIELGFQLHELEINVLAEVRHCVTYIGIGVQFLNLSADEQYFLSFVLAQQSAQQERLNQTQHTGYATQNQLRQF